MSHILNQLERAALSPLREGWIATDAVSGIGLSRRPFESLRTMGLATGRLRVATIAGLDTPSLTMAGVASMASPERNWTAFPI